MKKLKYNKITKELTVEENEVNKIIKIKNFFEKYKIFFEIFSSVFLTIMSITITGIGIEINKRDTEISEKELSILINDREPYFTIKSKEISNLNEDVAITQYIVTNKGGLITSVNIYSIKKDLIISFYSHRTGKTIKCYRYYLPDTFELKDETFSAYNEDEKAFYFFEYDKQKREEFVEKLTDELEISFAPYDDVGIIIYTSNRIGFSYINYKNEYYNSSLLFDDYGIHKASPNANGIFIRRIERGDYDTRSIVEELEKYVKNSLDSTI